MDTATTYLGIRLPHPFIAGASPLGRELDSIKRLEDGGCAAVVLPSLFEEQITLATDGYVKHMDPADSRFASALACFPGATGYSFDLEGYAEHVRRAKSSVSMPVIGSLNGTSAEAWLKYARIIEQAGADALEVNLYEVATDLDVSAVAIETQHAQIVTDLKRLLRIPVAIKLTPFFTAFGNVARRLDAAGADGLVLFNRFYQPDIDVDTMTTTADVELSTNAELRLRLRWVANLYGRLRCSLAISGGVATADDGVKAILAGASAIQLVSSLLRHGPAHIATMRDGLQAWMERHSLTALDAVRGLASLQDVAEPALYERGHYIRLLQRWGHERG
jgi:dihydroorotate dehydrogenase (fumarate)